MENNDNKKNKKWLIPLVIVIALLVIGLIGGVGYLLLKKDKSENIYYKFIDTLADNLEEIVDNASILENEYGVTGNLKAKITSQDKNIQKVGNVLNKLTLNLDTNINYNAKKSYMTYGLNYNNANFANIDVFLNNEKAYVSLGNLYDKVINLNSDDVDLGEIWQTLNTKEDKIIIQEMAKILKNSLSKEYITVTKETIKIADKNINTKKHTLTLKGNDFYKVSTNIITELKENKKIMTALEDITGKSETEILEELNKYVNDLENQNNKLVIDIYINKNTVEKVVYNYNDEIVNFNRTTTDTYEIVKDDNVIGTLLINKDNFKIAINYEDTTINLEIVDKDDNNKILLTGNVLDNEINLTMTKQDKEINGDVEIKVDENKTDITLTFSLTEKDKITIKDMDVSNAININDMKDSDFNKIVTNASKNDTIIKLIKDISGLFA